MEDLFQTQIQVKHHQESQSKEHQQPIDNHQSSQIQALRLNLKKYKHPVESVLSVAQSHLPKSEHQKQLLMEKIDNSIKFLQQTMSSKVNSSDQENLKILSLRKQLISASKQYSNERIDHLQIIFKHYCTHIFKTGKHMTFQRLQYQKIHLTLDRLFIFLKDFSLTVMKVNGVLKQIIDKNQVIIIFKRVSPNCRDLNFEQFIVCLQKISVLYYDCKTTYFIRKQQQRNYRDKVKAILLKKEKIKQQMLKRFHQKQDQLQIGQRQNKRTEQQQEQVQDDKKQKQNQNQNENDDMIQNLMKVKSSVEKQMQSQIKNKLQKKTKRKKNKQKREANINQIDQDGNQKNDQHQNNSQSNEEEESQDDDQVVLHAQDQIEGNLLKQNEFAFDASLLGLTLQQKIQYYYQLIDVDNAHSFRNKLRQLNLPIFQTHLQAQSQQSLKQKKAISKRQAQKKLQDSSVRKISQSVNQQNQRNQINKIGLKQLRERLNERNDKMKQSVPLISTDQYQKMKRKRSNYHQKMKQSAGSRVKKLSVGKIDLTQNSINLSSLSKLAYDNVNLTKFHPHNLYSQQADDEIFLRQYAIMSPTKKHKKTTSSMSKASLFQGNAKNNEKPSVVSKLQRNDKSSNNILQKTKKRLQEIETNQKKSEIDQLYRLKDRTNRQKKLIQKFTGRDKI